MNISDPRPEAEGRRELSDEEFIVQWFDATAKKFQPLHAPIEILRKRDWRKTFYGGPRKD